MAVKILAVDDNPINLKVVSLTLQNAGYEVQTASSGAEVLKTLTQYRPELIVLDIGMSEMDGYEVRRRIRANPVTASIPVMMLTAHDTLDKSRALA
jgi:CheY-like chemotaxis protein